MYAYIEMILLKKQVTFSKDFRIWSQRSIGSYPLSTKVRNRSDSESEFACAALKHNGKMA